VTDKNSVLPFQTVDLAKTFTGLSYQNPNARCICYEGTVKTKF